MGRRRFGAGRARRHHQCAAPRHLGRPVRCQGFALRHGRRVQHADLRYGYARQHPERYRPVPADRLGRRLAAGQFAGSPGNGRLRSLRTGPAPAVDHFGRPAAFRRHFQFLRQLCRWRGQALPGPSRPAVRRRARRIFGEGAEYRCRCAARPVNTNIVRLQSMSGDLGERYVLVNIPAAYIEAVENGRVATRHTAVVGRISRQTHIINSKIYEVILNPYWTSPRSIVEKDIVPLMRKDPEYLKKNSIRLIDGKGNEVAPETIDWNAEKAPNLTFRQDPGKTNAMASTKINFHNPNNEYMHDTPQQGLFNKLARFESSGCVRVQNVRDLTTWLLRDTPGWSRQQIEATIRAGQNSPDQACGRSACLFQIYHRLGCNRRRRAVPRRYLRDGWRAGTGAADHDRHRAGSRFRRARQPAAISLICLHRDRPRSFDRGAAFSLPAGRGEWGKWRKSHSPYCPCHARTVNTVPPPLKEL